MFQGVKSLVGRSFQRVPTAFILMHSRPRFNDLEPGNRVNPGGRPVTNLLIVTGRQRCDTLVGVTLFFRNISHLEP